MLLVLVPKCLPVRMALLWWSPHQVAFWQKTNDDNASEWMQVQNDFTAVDVAVLVLNHFPCDQQ
jgi:hypothetical protein